MGKAPENGSDEALEEYLDDPPAWLRDQLARCGENPARWLKPTSSSVAHQVYGTATRWAEVEAVLRRRFGKGGE